MIVCTYIKLIWKTRVSKGNIREVGHWPGQQDATNLKVLWGKDIKKYEI